MNPIDIYNKSPVFIQNIACNVEGFKLKKQRLGGAFKKYLNEYLDRDDWTDDKIIDYRNKRLKNIIQHAYDTVPYYYRLFRSLKLTPDDINTINDLSHLPVLNKEKVRELGDELLSSSYSKKELIATSTSGSTGTSLKLYHTRHQIQEQHALWWKYRMKLGLSLNTWCADFGSRTIVPRKQELPPFWRISYPLKQVKFSAFHGNNETYYDYYTEIEKRGLTWIHGYPTVITPFASFLVENNLNLKKQIQIVTTGGENIYDFQREIMHKAFGVKPYNHYGLGEGVANFSEDEKYDQIVDEDFSAVEFIKSGRDRLFKIIGTSFTSLAMPLIRYDTGDMAILPINKSDGGRRKVLFVDGRSGEYILLKSGNKIGAFSALFTETKHIIEAQLHQKLDYSVDIRYVSTKPQELVDQDLKIVKKKLEERIGDELDYKFIRVDKIKRTARGKLRYIISDFENNMTEDYL